mmetsp:Transcript_11226/g.20187  ORF Transcript_11226/g.20187 Transcript_11226/m.20187 type:complete len:207 (-) Transcript_11226:23-643(-)
MARPETKDSTTALNRISITEPISHDSSSDGSSSGLEESKEEVTKEDEDTGEGCADAPKVEPNGTSEEEQTETTSKETNGKDRGGVESISELSVDDVTSSVGRHEDGVHGRKESGRPAGFRLKLLLHGRVRFAGKVRHEVSPEGDKESKRLVGLQPSEHLQIIIVWDKGLGLRHDSTVEFVLLINTENQIDKRLQGHGSVQGLQYMK